MNFSYIAGIIDGEGTIGFTYRKKKNVHVPYVSIANSSLELLEAIQQFTRDHNINSIILRKNPRKINHKVGYTLRFIYKHAIKILCHVRFSLIVKREQADLMLDRHTKLTNRNGKYSLEELNEKSKIYARMSSLNSRGVVKPTHENSL